MCLCIFCRDWLCEDGQTLHITGGIPQIGNWQQEESYALTETDLPVWEGEVRAFLFLIVWSQPP